MKNLLLGLCGAALVTACGRNEPGTMGGEPGAPASVATGAPGEYQEEHLDSDDPALHLERLHTNFEEPVATSAAGGSGIGTAPEAHQTQFHDGDNVAPAIEYERELNPEGSVIGQTNARNTNAAPPAPTVP